MVYESSYESGRKPFLPDPTRGSWATSTDFIYVCLGFALRLEFFLGVWLFVTEMGVASIIPYVICMALFVVPLMVIKSFMGQFSSSGFISAFRVSPLFKGMGYVSLAINLATLMYYSVFATVPLLFLLNSFRPTLPWSCEAAEIWRTNLTEDEHLNTCNASTFVPDETEENSTEYRSALIFQVPGSLYFRSYFQNIKFDYENTVDFYLPWQLVGCNLICWGIIALIFYKFSSTAKLGILLRYSIWTIMALLLIMLVRFLCLPGAMIGLQHFFTPSFRDISYGLPCVPIFAMTAFGPGWGAFVSLASFNKFRTNIMRYSWIIGFGQVLIFVLFTLMAFIVEQHFTEMLSESIDENYYKYVMHDWTLYFSSGSAIANMPWANLWSILYYTMLTWAALVVLVTQLQCILVSTFDEFEILRPRKMEVTLWLIAIISILSIYFCSSIGAFYISALTTDVLFTQASLNLLLILVILWVYGRERFQRDIQFMLGQPFSTWKVNILRFVAPICLCLIMLGTFFLAYYEHFYATISLLVFAFFFIVLPWLFVPGYAIFNILQTTGSFGTRFKRCCRPTDWYPVETEERQQYEEAMGNMDITHQLNEVSDGVL